MQEALDFSDKVVIVTGGGKGVGRGISLRGWRILRSRHLLSSLRMTKRSVILRPGQSSTGRRISMAIEILRSRRSLNSLRMTFPSL